MRDVGEVGCGYGRGSPGCTLLLWPSVPGLHCPGPPHCRGTGDIPGCVTDPSSGQAVYTTTCPT